MNTDIKFRFVTRTISEDYRVFGNGGRDVYSDEAEFEPLRREFGIIPEDGGCAVLYHSYDDGNIFLVVSGMQRGVKDIANRYIRFSFCQIFTDKDKKCKSEAWAAFKQIITNWSEAELVLRSLFREQEQGFSFMQEDFISWFQKDYHYVPDFIIECNECVILPEADSDSWPDVWPAEGYILKWRNDSKELSCVRINESESESSESVENITMDLMKHKAAKRTNAMTGIFKKLFRVSDSASCQDKP